MKNHDCVFTPIAPEVSDEVDEEALIWEWCIRCGKLRLGDYTYTPGSDQQMIIVEDRKEKNDAEG